MEVQTQMQADLQIPEGTAVPVMQHDGLTRRLLVTLLSGGESWQPPEGVTPAVGYEKPDRTRGLYDRMPDGTDAVTLEGNVASVLLPPQMLSTPGTVLAQWGVFAISAEGVGLSLLVSIKSNAIVCVFLALVAGMEAAR